MRVRTQLTLVLVLLAGLTGALITAINAFGARQILFEQIRGRVLSIATTAAAGIDGGGHERIAGEEAEAMPEYRDLVVRLRAVRDANQSGDTTVRFVYTMRPAGNGGWIYVADAEERGPDHSAFGDPVEFDAGSSLRMDAPFADETFSRDEFGTWLSGNAPIRDAGGQPVGLLGVDVSAGEVMKELDTLLAISVAAAVAALAFGALLAAVVAHWFTSPLEKIDAVVRRISAGDLEARTDIPRRDEIGDLARAVNEMAVTLRQRDALKRALARYVSREVAEEVLAGGEAVIRGSSREVTVLIVDIRNFTGMSHIIPPEDLVGFLNRFFSRMIEAIFANRGTLDKLLGDGCLAIFGAPVADEQHRQLAVDAARQMLVHAEELAIDLKRDHDVDLRIGIGVHTGLAIVGNVGSEDRLEYTAIGETVNIASRVESLNKEFGTSLLLTEAVVSGLDGRGVFRDLGPAELRGVAKPVRIFTL